MLTSFYIYPPAEMGVVEVPCGGQDLWTSGWLYLYVKGLIHFFALIFIQRINRRGRQIAGQRGFAAPIFQFHQIISILSNWSEFFALKKTKQTITDWFYTLQQFWLLGRCIVLRNNNAYEIRWFYKNEMFFWLQNSFPSRKFFCKKLKNMSSLFQNEKMSILKSWHL